MRIDGRGVAATVLLALAISCLAKDLAMPLLIIASFGLTDRLLGAWTMRLRRL